MGNNELIEWMGNPDKLEWLYRNNPEQFRAWLSEALNYLPIYSTWSVFIVVVLPILFHFK
jgi:hypothetical protein